MRAKTVEEFALYYLSRGWSVNPLRPRNKRPAIRWLDYQHRHATENEVRDWFCTWPDANLGIVTEAISDLVVVDVDAKHGGDVCLIHNKVGLAPGMDLRGDGGCVVAPPSLHKSGRNYAWIGSRKPETTTLASMPEWLLKEARTGAGRVGHPLSYWRHVVRHK